MQAPTIPCASPTPGETPPEFAQLFAAEDRHFWFRARNRVIGRVVQQLIHGLSPGYRVLEVGCGTGNVLRILEQTCVQGEVTGLDLFDQGLEYARRRTKCNVVQADIHAMPFDHPFEMIGMFDVLEHLPDDRRVLRDLYTNLVPGGRLVLTVPAHKELWSHIDEFSGHYRRYKSAEVEEALHETGFQVEYVTQFMLALYPLMWLSRRLAGLKKTKTGDDTEQNRQLAAQELRIVPVLNTLLGWALAWERPWIGGRHKLFLGTSILAVASKPSALNGVLPQAA